VSARRGKRPAPLETDERAHAYAIRVLTRRAMSRRRMLEKLRLRGCDGEMAERVVERLSEAGLIDDRALAESVVAGQLARKPAGGVYLKSKLAERGVERGAADEAVAAALAERDLAADALQLARKRARAMSGLEPQVQRRRLTQFLARRGFEPDICRDAVRRALEPGGSDDEE
jgi:regulatory protein